MSGPSAINHDQAITNITNVTTMAITTRSTKAEILVHCSQLEARLEQGPDWRQIAAKLRTTSVTVWREAVMLARDMYNAGRASRQAVSFVVDELSRPVLR